MVATDINELVQKGIPAGFGKAELVETHISWVIVCHEFVFKIKKPIRYSFLDFSSLKKRLYYCQREIQLNRRLTSDMYLDVMDIRRTNERIVLGGSDGEIIDYAIKMRKQDRGKQMDVLLKNDEVTVEDIQRLADRIASFHKNSKPITDVDPMGIRQKFNDLGAEAVFLKEQLGSWSSDLINASLQKSEFFIHENKELLHARLSDGFFRDGHGDLHSRNIFLLPEPVIFDCIEFNDSYRQIDVLNEVAFLCMDLDAFGKVELSNQFINHYNKLFPAMQTVAERKLFTYYKCYRANIRAKVNSLRARSADSVAVRQKALDETVRYLRLMEKYLVQLFPSPEFG
jgi:aminoglycoside phosphotransferase family enzyme